MRALTFVLKLVRATMRSVSLSVVLTGCFILSRNAMTAALATSRPCKRRYHTTRLTGCMRLERRRVITGNGMEGSTPGCLKGRESVRDRIEGSTRDCLYGQHEGQQEDRMEGSTSRMEGGMEGKGPNHCGQVRLKGGGAFPKSLKGLACPWLQACQFCCSVPCAAKLSLEPLRM